MEPLIEHQLLALPHKDLRIANLVHVRSELHPQQKLLHVHL